MRVREGFIALALVMMFMTACSFGNFLAPEPTATPTAKTPNSRSAQDFRRQICISAKGGDAPISTDLTAVASAVDKCGQPGTKNYFVADWITH